MKISCLFLILNLCVYIAFADNLHFVTYDQHIYKVTEEEVDPSSLARLIGEITEYVEKIENAHSDQASNYYSPGTRIYKINNIPIEEALAIKTENKYVKVVYRDGGLNFTEMIMFHYILSITFLILLITIYILRERIRKKYEHSLPV